MILHDGFGGHGGIAKFNRDLLRALAANPNCTGIVAVPRLMPAPPGELPAGLDWVEDGIGGRLRHVHAARKVARGAGPFDAVICGHLNLLPIARLCRGRARLVLVAHGIEAWQRPARRWRALGIAAVDLCLAVSALTGERLCGWSGLPAERIMVAPNCIAPEDFGPAPKRADLVARLGLEGRIVLMTLARLEASERYKGIDEMLDILPALAREMPDIVYVVAGDGSDRARLQARAATEPGLHGRCVFPGYIAEAEKADYLRLADAFVLAGHGEGFGIVLLEAMACGIPVIGSRRDGTREALADGALGTLVDPYDRDDLMAGLKTALARPRGAVPAGLAAFGADRFAARIDAALARLAAL
jgi:phosphatidyl-myo-inositol dimannoside synthase